MYRLKTTNEPGVRAVEELAAEKNVRLLLYLFECLLKNEVKKPLKRFEYEIWRF